MWPDQKVMSVSTDLLHTISGAYCLPIVACMAYSVTKEGELSPGVDMFGNVAWDSTRLKAQRKGEELRQQGFAGPAMLPVQELEYRAFRDSLSELESQFSVRDRMVAGSTDGRGNG